MARTLLLDTNIAAAPLLQCLIEAGHEVYIAGGNPDDALARSYGNYIRHDYSNSVTTLDLIERLGIEFLIPGCNDRSYQTCAEITDLRAFPGIDSAENTRIINNKAAFRTWAQANRLPVPTVLKRSDIRANRPVIVKPEEAYSGRGATVLRSPTPEALAEAEALACAASQSGKCLIEDFVEGQLFSHTAFADQNGVLVDFIVEEHGSASPLAVDTSHLVTDFPAAPLASIRKVVLFMFKALGLPPGLMHTQFILGADDIYIIEMTRRCPGDLYSVLIQASTGLNYAENYVRPFLGEAFNFKYREPASGLILRHTISTIDPIVFGTLRFRRPLDIERYVALARSGDRLDASPKGRIGIGFFCARSTEDLHDIKMSALTRDLYDIYPPEVW